MSNRHTLFVSIKPIMLRSTPGEQDPVLETLRSEIEELKENINSNNNANFNSDELINKNVYLDIHLYDLLF